MPTSFKKRVLYLPSTPLNILVSIAHATTFSKEQSAQIVLIDQKCLDDNVYFNALNNWKNSPFERVDLTLGQAKGWARMAERKSNFAKLAGLVDLFQPDVIAVGSDRRVEFQYLMHVCQLKSSAVEGWYIDDGLYSYAGRPGYWLKDGVNAILKKIAYGLWWQEPCTVGASRWIDQVWLFQPERAVKALDDKEKHTLSPQWFASPRIQDLSRLVFLESGLNDSELNRLQNIDVIVLIPHPNNIKKIAGYQTRIMQFMADLKKQGKAVAIKYHPRTDMIDPLGLQKNYQATLIPSSLAFEFVLPVLKLQAIVVGDVGTTLLTTKWLRPDIQSFAVLSEENDFESGFREVFASLGVTVLSDFNAILEERSHD